MNKKRDVHERAAAEFDKLARGETHGPGVLHEDTQRCADFETLAAELRDAAKMCVPEKTIRVYWGGDGAAFSAERNIDADGKWTDWSWSCSRVAAGKYAGGTEDTMAEAIAAAAEAEAETEGEADVRADD